MGYGSWATFLTHEKMITPDFLLQNPLSLNGCVLNQHTIEFYFFLIHPTFFFQKHLNMSYSKLVFDIYIQNS